MKIRAFLLATLAVGALVSCNKSDADKTYDNKIDAAKDSIDMAADRAKAALDAERDAYYADVDMRMDRMNAYLDSLETEYNKSRGSAKIAIRKRISGITATRDTMRIWYVDLKGSDREIYVVKRQRFDSIMDAENARNGFWDKNRNYQPKPADGAADGVKLAPNKNK
ncbi:MAG: hypothetical protein SGJ05_05930 [bacterium]|nr:hypothetical protein [bacterium]